MEIKLSKLGPIKEINVNLNKSLLIFCGPNNTGKTFAAYAVYGLFRTSRRIKQFLQLEKFSNRFTLKQNGRICVDFNDFLIKNEKSISEQFELAFLENLTNIFATPISSFRKGCGIDLKLDLEVILQKMKASEVDEDLKFGKASIHLMKKKNSLMWDIYYVKEPDGQEEKFPFAIIYKVTMSKILQYFLQVTFNKVYITPSERSAINIFSRELSEKRNRFLDQILAYKEKKDEELYEIENQVRRYSLPIRESLLIAEDLANLQKNTSEFSFLGEYLENEILKGSIKISKEGELQFLPNKPAKIKLDLHVTGSMVKSLSNLVFYFKHIAQKEDFIIIDEPETNLHPNTQRLIAKFLVRVVNSGFKVLISTHSDYIIREINNLIMLYNIKNNKDLLEKYSYKKEELIDHNKIGAYLFEVNKIKLLPTDEFGISISTIDKEITVLNESSEDIYHTLINA